MGVKYAFRRHNEPLERHHDRSDLSVQRRGSATQRSSAMADSSWFDSFKSLDRVIKDGFDDLKTKSKFELYLNL